MKSERATSGIELFAGDISRSVRSAAGDIIGELIAIFYPNGKVPESLVQYFLSLVNNDNNNNNNNVPGEIYNGLDQRDPERPVICAFNFPAVVLILGESRWDDLKETYLLLTQNIQAKVRRSLSCSLHEIARVIGPKKAEECLLAVFTLYLVDTDEVQSGVIENLASFISCLPQAARNNCLPSLFGIWDDLKQRWRLRNTIARQMPTICRLFDSRNVINHLLPLAIKIVEDDVATVRETAIACFPALFEVVYNDDTVFTELINRVREFAFENKFRSRVAFIQICRALALSAFPKPEFERYFIPILKKFSTDNVVNVRITLVRLIRDLCRIEQYYQDPTSKSQIIDMIKQLAEDPDFDVRSLLFMTLSHEERLKFITTIRQQSTADIKSMNPQEKLNVIDATNNDGNDDNDKDVNADKVNVDNNADVDNNVDVDNNNDNTNNDNDNNNDNNSTNVNSAVSIVDHHQQ